MIGDYAQCFVRWAASLETGTEGGTECRLNVLGVLEILHVFIIDDYRS